MYAGERPCEIDGGQLNENEPCAADSQEARDLACGPLPGRAIEVSAHAREQHERRRTDMGDPAGEKPRGGKPVKSTAAE